MLLIHLLVMAEEKIDLLTQYHGIAYKLKKKRLLKKPNVTEASQQFETLGRNFEREDLAQYAGLCYQAAAKCQNSLGNHMEEGLLLLTSSRKFMTAYIENLNDRFIPNPSFLNHSYLLYKDCLARLNKCEELNKLVKEVFMGNIILEMADNLKVKAGLATEGGQEYEKALEFFSNFPFEKINCLRTIVSLKIEVGDYKNCLQLVNKIINEAKHLPGSATKEIILRDSEITRVFLLLILRPTLQQILPEDAQVLEKYAWVEASTNSNMKDLSTALRNQGLSMIEEDLFLNLQSLVMACQYSDIESLEFLEKDLMQYLNCEQKTLLQSLVKQYKT